MTRHRDSLADLERKLQAYERMGLRQAAQKMRERIRALKQAGDRLKSYQFKQEEEK